MSNMRVVQAGQDIDGNQAFEHAFEPLVVQEILLECDPKKPGIPICTLQSAAGETQEFHARALRSRPGRFKTRIPGEIAWSGVKVTMYRDKPSHLIAMKLVGKAPGIS